METSNEIVQAATKEVKKRGNTCGNPGTDVRKCGKGNPQAYKNSKLGDGMYNFKGGEITQLMRQAIEIKEWPPIDLDSDEDVDERINQYWMYCAEHDARPMVSGIALALGIDRGTLHAWKNGIRRAGPGSSRVNIIKKAYSILEFMWEQYMTTGKINPASGCFIGKNNFGYVDEMKLEVTPNTGLAQEHTAEEIEQKVLEDIPVDVDCERDK